jgi:CheY-like chemotaxis protein
VKPLSRLDDRRVIDVDHRPAILIVDGDRVSERAVELALAPCDYAIEWARDGASALDIMRQSRTDVVVADSMLADMPGATLMRRSVELCGPGAPAFVFVTVDRAASTRIALLTAGAADFVVKPFIADELRARVVNTLAARRSSRMLAMDGFTGLAGHCASVPVADLLAMLEFGRKSGVVHVSVGPALGRLVLDGGRVVHAEVGLLSGGDAFFVLLRSHSGLFRFELGEVDAPRTLNARVSELLLESAVREDTDRHCLDDDARRRTEAALRELGVVKAPIKLRSRRGTPVAPSLLPAAQRLMVALADPFSLGDLVLAPELPSGPIAQLRIELWASPSDGAMAMLALASSPGYHFVLAALGGGGERLHLQFEIQTASLIVTLVDIDGRVELPSAEPNAIIVAPPRGELISLAPQRLAELTGRVLGDDALVVLAAGGPALHATVSRLAERADGVSRYQAAGATLASDPRELLGGALRLWVSSRDHDG